jgi:hypothetical protein
MTEDISRLDKYKSNESMMPPNSLRVVSIFKEINKQSEQLYEMIRADIRETIGQYP